MNGILCLQSECFKFIPIISVGKGVYDLYQYVTMPEIRTNAGNQNRYYVELKERSFVEWIFLFIPVVGNIVLVGFAIYRYFSSPTKTNTREDDILHVLPIEQPVIPSISEGVEELRHDMLEILQDSKDRKLRNRVYSPCLDSALKGQDCGKLTVQESDQSSNAGHPIRMAEAVESKDSEVNTGNSRVSEHEVVTTNQTQALKSLFTPRLLAEFGVALKREHDKNFCYNEYNFITRLTVQRELEIPSFKILSIEIDGISQIANLWREVQSQVNFLPFVFQQILLPHGFFRVSISNDPVQNIRNGALKISSDSGFKISISAEEQNEPCHVDLKLLAEGMLLHERMSIEVLPEKTLIFSGLQQYELNELGSAIGSSDRSQILKGLAQFLASRRPTGFLWELNFMNLRERIENGCFVLSSTSTLKLSLSPIERAHEFALSILQNAHPSLTQELVEADADAFLYFLFRTVLHFCDLELLGFLRSEIPSFLKPETQEKIREMKEDQVFNEHITAISQSRDLKKRLKEYDCVPLEEFDQKVAREENASIEFIIYKCKGIASYELQGSDYLTESTRVASICLAERRSSNHAVVTKREWVSGILSRLEHNSRDAESFYNLGVHLDSSAEQAVLLKDGRRLSAKECYLEAIKLHSSYADAYYNLGVFLSKSSQKQLSVVFEDATSLVLDAEGLYVKAIESNPRHAYAYFNLGMLLLDKKGSVALKNGQILTAERCFVQVLAHERGNAVAFAYLGMALQREKRDSTRLEDGQVLTAKQCFTEAIEMDPKCFIGFWNLANIIEDDSFIITRQGKTFNAKECLIESIALNPTNPYPFFSLGVRLFEKDERQLLLKDGSWIDAQKCFVKALALNHPAQDQIFNSLGCSLAKTGNSNVQLENGRRLTVRQCFEEAVRINPENSIARSNLQKCYTISKK